MVGKTKAGVLRIILGIVTCSVVAVINEILGIIQGIKILTMSNEAFAEADKASLLAGIPSGK